jgi:site-specific DNA-methyltransferase (adenine-specific)
MTEPYYRDDLVTLYHGDCLEVTEWLAADVLVTDPPYGVAWAAGSLNDVPARRAIAVQSILSDEDTATRDAALEAWGKKPAVVFGSWRYPVAGKITHRLIWHKQGRQPGISRAAYFPNDEEIYLLGSGWTGGPTPTVLTTTEQRGRQPKLIGHPTPKPVGLMETLVSKSPTGVIADPFAGSGATLVAARNLGRTCIGVELEEPYCELIAKRLAQQPLRLYPAHNETRSSGWSGTEQAFDLESLII